MDNGMGFLRLPLELRYQIYHYALLSDNFITVWRGHQGRRSHPSPDQDGATAQSLKSVAFNLLLASRTVHAEAAPIFYRGNEFNFYGAHDLKEEINWLTSIGESNRRQLTTIETTLRAPSTAYQYKDGSRIAFEDQYLPEGPCERYPLLQLPAEGWGRTDDGKWEPGTVFHIEPAWEDFFRLVGDGEAGAPALTWRILSNHPGIPGAMEDPYGQSNDELWYSMDIPNVFEHWRGKHSSARAVTVIWRAGARDLEDGEEDFFADLDDAGWDVDRDDPWLDDTERETSEEYGRCYFLLTRRPLGDRVEADGPNPYGGSNDPVGVGNVAPWELKAPHRLE